NPLLSLTHKSRVVRRVSRRAGYRAAALLRSSHRLHARSSSCSIWSDRSQHGCAEWPELVVAAIIKAGELDEPLEPAVGATTRQKGDDVDGLDNEISRHGDHGLLHQLLEAVESRFGGVGVHGGDAAGMAGVPGFQHVE